MAKTFSALDLAQLHIKRIFESWEAEREQLAALVQAINTGLEPDPDTDCRTFQEWRLAQVAMALLDDAREFNTLKSLAGVTA